MVGKESRNRYYQFLIINHRKIFVISIFIIGIVLRIIAIGTREIAYDDAFSFFLSRGSLSDIILGTAADTMPPLYYFLLHFWMKISTDLWFLRLLNIIINLMTAFLVYVLTKELFNPTSAIVATFLFLISPYQIYHSQELRMYALLLFGQVGYYYSFLKIIRSSGKRENLWIIATVGFGLIAMYAHNLGIIGLVSINIILLLYRNKKIVKSLFIVQMLILFFSIPWLYYLPQQLDKIQQAFWTQPPGIVDVFQALLSLFAFLPMPTIFMGISLIIIIQSIVMLCVYVFKIKSKKAYIVALFIFVSPIILIVLSYLVKPVFVPRIFILSSVWFFILFAIFTEKNLNYSLGKINLGLFICLSIFSLPYYYEFQSFPRSSFKELNYKIERYGPQEFIVHDNKLSFFPTMFYEERENSYYLKDPKGSPNDTLAYPSQLAMGYIASENIEQFLDRDSLVFIVFQKTLDEYSENDLSHPVLEKLQNTYTTIKVNAVGDIVLFEYGDKR
jgi:hypothetical protein